MHDSIKITFFADIDDELTVFQISFDKFGSGVDRVAVSGDKGIEHGDFVSFVEKIFSTGTADVAGTSGNEDFFHFFFISI